MLERLRKYSTVFRALSYTDALPHKRGRTAKKVWARLGRGENIPDSVWRAAQVIVEEGSSRVRSQRSRYAADLIDKTHKFLMCVEESEDVIETIVEKQIQRCSPMFATPPLVIRSHPIHPENEAE